MKKDNKKALKITIKKMVPAVLIAMIATALGLLSLYRSKVPMINDFGTMLTIGIVAAFIIAVLLFLPFLFIRDTNFPKEEKKKENNKVSNKIIHKMVGFIVKFKYVILSIAILLAVVGIVVDLDAPAETNLENFMPQDSEALKDIRELRDLIGSTEQIAIVFESENILMTNNLDSIILIEQALNSAFDDEIIEMTSLIKLFNQMGLNDTSTMTEASLKNIPLDQRKLFINDTSTKTVINVSIGEMSDEEFTSFIAEIDSILLEHGSGMKIAVTGQSIIDSEMMFALTNGRYEITIIGLLLIFFTLLIIYRSFYKALLPIIPILLIVGWSGGMMAIFGMSYTPLTATLGALIMGIGTEFTILITERFEEEKLKTEDRKLAIQNTLSSMSKPIIVSALTTMGGFSALIFSDFLILSNFGIMTVVNLSLALLSTIFVLPALLAVTFKGNKNYVDLTV